MNTKNKNAMKKISILLLALLPLITMAHNGNEKKKKTLKATVTVTKQGKLQVNQNLPELKDLEKDINNLLKDVNIETSDGKKHQLSIKVDIKTK